MLSSVCMASYQTTATARSGLTASFSGIKRYEEYVSLPSERRCFKLTIKPDCYRKQLAPDDGAELHWSPDVTPPKSQNVCRCL